MPSIQLLFEGVAELKMLHGHARFVSLDLCVHCHYRTDNGRNWQREEDWGSRHSRGLPTPNHPVWVLLLHRSL